MNTSNIDLEVKVNHKKALEQIENIKTKLIEVSDLMAQIKKTKVDITVSLIRVDKKWYQFWK
jgi:uncharacterized alkaline shock family protein YloU